MVGCCTCKQYTTVSIASSLLLLLLRFIIIGIITTHCTSYEALYVDIALLYHTKG